MVLKKILKVIIFIIAFILVLWIAWFYMWNTSQVGLCQKAENTGWAPAFDGGPISCDGKRLEKNSPLIENGYTCYCHKPNTCWDGEECVNLPDNN